MTKIMPAATCASPSAASSLHRRARQTASNEFAPRQLRRRRQGAPRRRGMPHQRQTLENFVMKYQGATSWAVVEDSFPWSAGPPAAAADVFSLERRAPCGRRRRERLVAHRPKRGHRAAQRLGRRADDGRGPRRKRAPTSPIRPDITDDDADVGQAERLAGPSVGREAAIRNLVGERCADGTSKRYQKAGRRCVVPGRARRRIGPRVSLRRPASTRRRSSLPLRPAALEAIFVRTVRGGNCDDQGPSRTGTPVGDAIELTGMSHDLRARANGRRRRLPARGGRRSKCNTDNNAVLRRARACSRW